MGLIWWTQFSENRGRVGLLSDNISNCALCFNCCKNIYNSNYFLNYLIINDYVVNCVIVYIVYTNEIMI